MIEIFNIEKKFGNKHVLKNLNAKFEQGKINLVIGESGSGKTTLIKILVGLYKHDSGVVLFDKQDVGLMRNKETRKLRKEIGMLFQGGALYDYMTVEENIMFPLNMFTNDLHQKKLDRVNFCLKRVNLSGTNNLFPSEISGGMKKRVAIARAIVMQPKYLFCDEPNSGLDPKTSIVIDNLIKEITLEYNITTVINTHDMNSTMVIGDNISFIHQGQMWWKGNKSELEKSDNKELIDFVFASNSLKKC